MDCVGRKHHRKGCGTCRDASTLQQALQFVQGTRHPHSRGVFGAAKRLTQRTEVLLLKKSKQYRLAVLLSKFVVATAVYVGFRLVVTALVSPSDNDTTENWMASGVAVLLIAAFSPVVIFTSLRFAHAQAGSVARGFAGTGLSALPTGRLLGNVSRLAGPLVGSAKASLKGRITHLRNH